MHHMLMLTAYGFLIFGGTLHFLIDVVSQHVRHKRAPGPETTLYNGLHTAYAMGQIILGVVGITLAQRAPELLDQWPMLTLTGAAAVGWMVFNFMFIEYREPKRILAVFMALALAAAVT